MTKEKKLTIIGIVAVLILLLGASYAYFSVSTTSTGTSSVGVTTPDTGTVTLSGDNASLSMQLVPSDMAQGNSNVTYYATPTGKSTDSANAETVLGTASVSPSTDNSYYHCTYTLELTHSGTNDMYDLFNHKTGNTYDYTNRSEGQILLTVNGQVYDFYNEFPEEIEGEFDIHNPNTVDITVGMKYINSSTIDQVYLKNSDITINIGLKDDTFHCDLTEGPEKPRLASVMTTENELIQEYKGEGWVEGENPYFTNHIYHWYVPNSDSLSNSLNGHTMAENAATVKNSWNVVFGGFCWQAIRTTENGGVKLLYNGEPIVGTDSTTGETTYDCSETNRKYILHVGISGARAEQTGFSSSTSWKYGSSYTVSGTQITLTDTIDSTWSESNYTNNHLEGKYTCKNDTEICTTMYLIDGYNNTTSAWAYPMTANIDYNLVGNSPFNSTYNSPASVGYMYNDNTQYVQKSISGTSNTYNFSNTITYNNGTYTLDMSDSNAVTINDFSNDTNRNKVGKAHYVCLDSSNNPLVNTTSCAQVGYIYYIDYFSGTMIAYFMPLSNGEYISTDRSSTSGMTKWADNNNLLYRMLYAENVNTKDSNAKQAIDAWYKMNILGKSFESKIDTEEIYCVDRSSSNNFGSWNLNANNITTNLSFRDLGSSTVSINNSNTTVYNISCPNKMDAYSKDATTKGNGALTYPVGLISKPEMENLGPDAVRTYTKKNMNNYWLGSPYYLYLGNAYEYRMYYSGRVNNDRVYFSIGVRPAVSLDSDAEYTRGDGSMMNPYVVDET